MKWKRVCFISFALACLGTAVSGRTLYVSPLGTNDYTGYYPNWLGAATTISAAVTRADTSGDLILVTNATYRITNQIVITSNITIRSWNSGNLDRTNTIVDCQRSNRCFYINNSGAVIAGFTIMNGSNTYGGGVCIDSSGGTVSNCIITDNLIDKGVVDYQGGGGVYMNGSAAAVKNCVIQRNQRLEDVKICGGAGVMITGGGLLKDCEIIGNTNSASVTGGGGGVFVYNGGTLDHCQVISNVAGANMAGLYLYTGSILLTNCTVAGNNCTRALASSGMAIGGLYAAGVGIVITDCVISNNTCSGNQNAQSGGCALGGGVLMRNCQIVNNWSPLGNKKGGLCIVGVSTVTECVVRGNYPGGVSSDQNGNCSWRLVNCLIAGNTGNGVEIMHRPSIINCTIVSNTATGIMDYNAAYPSTCTVVNTIVYLNPTANYTPSANSQYFFTNSCTTPSPPLGTGNTTNDPLFVNGAAGNYRLRTDSPCVNAGTNNETWMATGLDLDGRPRLRYGYVDMGAYEFIRSGMIITVH